MRSSDHGTHVRQHPHESYKMEGSDQSPLPSRLSAEGNEEYEDGYQTFAQNDRWSNFLDTLGLSSLRRRTLTQRYSYDSESAFAHGHCKTKHLHHLTANNSLHSSNLRTIVKQSCLILPVLVLMTFGIVFILQIVIGSASLLWDIDAFHDRFQPHWGSPGHYGDGMAHYPTDATRDIVPIPVHSHNDYWRRIPLFEALHYGCIGVEADVWHFDDDLYVGHNTASLTRNRTFRNLYVDPLIALLDRMNPETEFVNASKHGVWDTDSGQNLVLLVDLKTDGRETFPIVSQQLEGLRSKGYLTHFNGTHTVPGAITVVGTGNTPFDMVIANETYRDIFFDAPLERLWEEPGTTSTPDVPDPMESENDERNVNDHNIAPSGAPRRRGQGNTGLDAETPSSAFNAGTSYYASIDFHAAVGPVWRGHLSAKQMDIIRGQIRGAKEHGLKSRYWNTPMWPIGLRNHIWDVLVREGTDMLNADDLRSASRHDWRK